MSRKFLSNWPFAFGKFCRIVFFERFKVWRRLFGRKIIIHEKGLSRPGWRSRLSRWPVFGFRRFHPRWKRCSGRNRGLRRSIGGRPNSRSSCCCMACTPVASRDLCCSGSCWRGRRRGLCSQPGRSRFFLVVFAWWQRRMSGCPGILPSFHWRCSRQRC